jgi:hypothetical protein
MVNVKVRGLLPAAFDAVIVKLNEPDCVGVPESKPVELKVSPFGIVPAVCDQLIGVSPVAFSC